MKLTSARPRRPARSRLASRRKGLHVVRREGGFRRVERHRGQRADLGGLDQGEAGFGSRRGGLRRRKRRFRAHWRPSNPTARPAAPPRRAARPQRSRPSGRVLALLGDLLTDLARRHGCQKCSKGRLVEQPTADRAGRAAMPRHRSLRARDRREAPHLAERPEDPHPRGVPQAGASSPRMRSLKPRRSAWSSPIESPG